MNAIAVQSEIFGWESLDQSLLAGLTAEHTKQFDEAIPVCMKSAAAEAEATNVAQSSVMLRKFEIALEYWARDRYLLHCKVWLNHEPKVPAEGIRSIRDKAVLPFIDYCAAAMTLEFTQIIASDVAIAKWRRVIAKIKSRVFHTFEARAVEQEYFVITASAASAVAQEKWEQLKSSFRYSNADPLMFAYADYATTTLFGDWDVRTDRSPKNAAVQSDFEALASKCGTLLGCPQGSQPLTFWLHQVFHEMIETKAHEFLLIGPPPQNGGFLQHVWEASATYCARLEKRSLEASLPATPPAARPRPRSNSQPAHGSKLADPVKHPTMDLSETMTAVSASKATVYRYVSEGRLARPGLNRKAGKRSKFLVLTSSVLKLLQEEDHT